MTLWDAYNTKTKRLSAHSLLIDALSYLRGRERALDFGCGAMRDISAIANAGFEHIDAVDSNPSVEKVAREKIQNGIPLTFYLSFFDEFDFSSKKYDLISAQYALPFNPPETFEAMFGRLVSSLKIGAVFTGQFFGTEDGWANNPKMTFHTEKEIRNLLANLDIHVLREEKREGKTALGKEKFWHVFHVIATK